MLHIPPEILAEVFKHSLPNSSLPAQGSSPLLVCQICRYWRETAISTPSLWSSIDILLDGVNNIEEIEQEVVIRLELLELWLSHSRKHPLDLCVNINFRRSPHPSLLLLLESILRHCDRWEVVSLHVPLDFLPLIRGKMPLLRELTFGPAGIPIDEDAAPTLFDQAPLLTKAVLNDTFVPGCIHLPWYQLTHLEGLCLLEQGCLTILNLTRNLVRCEVHLVGGQEPEDSEIVTLPALHEFRLLSDEGNIDSLVILDHLALPALRILQVPEPFHEQPITVLKNLLGRSGCSLRELHITHSNEGSKKAYRAALALYPPHVVTVTACK